MSFPNSYESLGVFPGPWMLSLSESDDSSSEGIVITIGRGRVRVGVLVFFVEMIFSV